MDLWIRSQDKRILMKVEQLMLINSNSFTINGAGENWDYDLATYKTKERALEVLDEIQRNISDGKYDYIRSRFRVDGYVNDIDIPYQKTTVYEMPEE